MQWIGNFSACPGGGGGGGGGEYYFDKVLPFSLRSAPFLFNQLSDALGKNYLNISSIIHILDDLFFPNQYPPPSVQQLCARSLPCLRT